MKPIRHPRIALMSLALLTCSGISVRGNATPADKAPTDKAPGTLLFSDDFNREDGSKTKDAVGSGWTTNSASRAKGNKQVTLQDGAMHIAMHKEADHPVSVVHNAPFQNGTVELRFMLEDDKDTLGVDFADLDCKEVHAGHLFRVTAGAKKIDINDMKSGSMNLKFQEAKEANAITPAQKKALAAANKSFPLTVEPGKWHSLRIDVQGDTIHVAVDAKELGSFSSPGFAHPTKKIIRLAVPHKAVVDDVKAYAKPAADKA